ncbi:hypothetical protein SPONN_1029 [uncultured Candidatus Thioglobus sp.]|nr:hypothetical protein SPONN_1029 [uncultured Candidatus Thioglobus sp.]
MKILSSRGGEIFAPPLVFRCWVAKKHNHQEIYPPYFSQPY